MRWESNSHRQRDYVVGDTGVVLHVLLNLSFVEKLPFPPFMKYAMQIIFIAATRYVLNYVWTKYHLLLLEEIYFNIDEQLMNAPIQTCLIAMFLYFLKNCPEIDSQARFTALDCTCSTFHEKQEVFTPKLQTNMPFDLIIWIFMEKCYTNAANLKLTTFESRSIFGTC